MKVPFRKIPTFNYQTKEWSFTSFDSQQHFAEFLDSLFSEPGEYDFDESTTVWNEEAVRFKKNKSQYCKFPKNTREYRDYWTTQKERCRKGVLYLNGEKKFYVTRELYMLLNFLPPAQNKERGNDQEFLYVRDVQYHIALYHKRAEAHHKHGVIVKKRQCASSIYHAAKLINVYWFEKNAVLRNLAGDEAYLTGEKGIWNYYNGFRDFLNEHTAWYRNNSPNSDLKWIQRLETYINGKRGFSGRKSMMTGTTFKRNPTAGVGGSAYYNYFEEAGTFNKLDKTYIYMRPQLEAGAITTGYFMAAGSVGELKDCGPLKKFIESPEANNFLGVVNTWVNKDRIPKVTGLYIPEQWGFPPYIDKYGNSMVKEALEYINRDYEEREKDMDPEDYQLHISQRPRYMDEAFAYREVSKWPMRKIEKRQQFIKDEKIEGRRVELDEDKDGNPTWKMSDKHEMPYPVPKAQADKSGVAIMFEPPDHRFRYYAGVDTIASDTTTTSESLFCIYIVKGISEIIYKDEETGQERRREEGIKEVFKWVGRLNSADDTNNYGILAMKLYKAMTLAERNKENFINACIRTGIASRYLLKEKELPFNKEMDFTKEYTTDEYGIYMDSTGKKQERIESYGIEYINQELDCIYKKDAEGNYTSEKLKIYYGIDRINSSRLLEELRHIGKQNTDEAQAWLLAITAAKTYEIQGIKSKVWDLKEAPKKIEKRTRTINMLGSPKPNQNRKTRIINLL